MSHFEFADYSNVPTYYVDTAIPEPAGDGNVRIYNCITKNGILIPQVEIIIHSTRLIVAARAVSATAMEIFNTEQLVLGARH